MKKNADLSFIDEIEELHAISPVVMEVISLLSSPSPPTRPIVQRIELDAGMASFLLKYCNSPLFHFRVQVNTVAHALNMLGIPRTKAILLTFFFKHLHDKSRKKYIGSYLWEHSVNVAFIARELANRLGSKDAADEAYMAGLLHDIGKLVIYFHDPGIYEEIMQEADRDRKAFLPMEMETYRFSHVDAGFYLMNKWGFSDILKNSVMFHHDINPKERARVVNLASFANSTTHFAIDRKEDVPEAFLKYYGITGEQYDKMLDEILEVVIEARLMHLD
jgi:putative nucleotidyltransferase with HDIG domain